MLYCQQIKNYQGQKINLSILEYLTLSPRLILSDLSLGTGHKVIKVTDITSWRETDDC